MVKFCGRNETQTSGVALTLKDTLLLNVHARLKTEDVIMNSSKPLDFRTLLVLLQTTRKASASLVLVSFHLSSLQYFIVAICSSISSFASLDRF
jgi:hypothetical protein